MSSNTILTYLTTKIDHESKCYRTIPKDTCIKCRNKLFFEDHGRVCSQCRDYHVCQECYKKTFGYKCPDHEFAIHCKTCKTIYVPADSGCPMCKKLI